MGSHLPRDVPCIFGNTREHLLALAEFSEIFPHDDRVQVKQAVAERLAGIRDTERYPVRGIRPDGTVIEVRIHGSRTRYRGRDAIIGIVTKIATESPGPGVR